MSTTEKEVNCPIHGTHGNLSHGRCWYCVQIGNAPSAPSATSSTRAPGTVRVIK